MTLNSANQLGSPHTHTLPPPAAPPLALDRLVWAESGRPGSFGLDPIKGERREDGQLWRLLSLPKTTVDGPERPNRVGAWARSIVPIDKALPGGSMRGEISREEEEDVREEEKREDGRRDVKADKRRIAGGEEEEEKTS